MAKHLRNLILILVSTLLASCSSTPPASSDSSPQSGGLTENQQTEINTRNEALKTQHETIWNLIGLSEKAKDELQGIVLAVNTQVMKNKLTNNPSTFAHATEVKRSKNPLTRDKYMSNHRKRFDMLKISAPTQKELIKAAEFVWSALHDKKAPFTAEQRKTAMVLQDMMKKMGGPPPCCDDNIFERAKASN